MKRRALLASVLLLFGVCGAWAAWPHGGPRRKGEAAIAIRDAVPGYQQFSTERFTVPRLTAAYERAWYFTESPTVKRGPELRAALEEATMLYDHVDLFLLAHGNRYIDEVRVLPAEQRAKLRLVYDTGGGSSRQGRDWVALGAQQFIGHPGGNIAPVFYVKFLPRWIEGHDAEKAMRAANDDVHALLYGPLGSFANRWVDRDALWLGTEAVLYRR
jgi:hypothetical protein